MGVVFISYRREDTAGEARALYNDLAKLLGEERVFMDVDDIALGLDFREVLRQRLADCEVMLALIGRGWLDARDESGARRLDQPGDFVRLEIATALERKIPVTPVLLKEARAPQDEHLPADLKGLAFRNGFPIRHETWESNVQELVRRLGLAPPTPAPAARSRRPVLLGLGAAVLAGAAGLWYGLRPGPTPPPVPAPTADPSIARGLVADLVGNDKSARQAAADRLERDFLRSPDALRAAVAHLDWGRFRTLAGAAPRAQLLHYLLASDEAAWTPELRAQAGRAIASLREQIAANESSFRPEIVQRIGELAKRLGI